MANLHVQDTTVGATGAGTSQQTGAFGTNPVLGNYILVAAWGWRSITVTSCAFSDTAGNTYTVPTGAFEGLSGDLWMACGFAKVTATGTAFKVTATPNVSSGSISTVAAEFSGVAASTPLDGAAVGATGQTGIPAPGNLILTPGSVVFALFASDQTTYTTYGYSTPAGFTRAGFQNDGSTFQVGEAIWAIDPTSPSNPSWATGTVKWASAQFALLAEGGGGGGPPADSGSSVGVGMQRPVAAGWV